MAQHSLDGQMCFFSEEEEESLRARLLRAKNPGAVDIFGSNPTGGCQFWHAIHKVKAFKLGQIAPMRHVELNFPQCNVVG